MRWAVACQLDLLRLDKNRVRAKPFAGFQGQAHELIVSHMADIGLKVGDERRFRPVAALHLKNPDPGFDARLNGWKWRNRFKGPGVAFPPETMHVCVHILDAGVTVVFLGKQGVELCERLQKIRVVVMRDAMLAPVTYFA